MIASGYLTRKHVVVGICLVVAALHFVAGPRYRGPWPAFVHGYLMDILVPFALYLLLGVSGLAVLRSRVVRGVIVFAIGGLVELLQYAGVPLFGATFDQLDLFMYAVGVVGGVIVEATAMSRLGAGSGARASGDAK
jgi:hypothetical protein